MSLVRRLLARTFGSPSEPPAEVALLESQIQAINRFPDQNPNPVMRMTNDGLLTYANPASEPVRRAIGAQVGDQLAADFFERLTQAARAPSAQPIEVINDHLTFAVLPVAVPDFGFINLYGTDITATKVIDKFPNQNPNPVLRVSRDGRLLYANATSAPIVDALRLRVGQPVPAELWTQIDERLAGSARRPLEVTTPAGQVFTILPVPIDEFGFINLYGTDVTAARAIEEANRENERLLLNILPPPIADRLRAGERLIADRFDDATLLIADIVGFTELSSGMSPAQVVDMLNEVFSACDALVDRYGLEKVKTIGDAYMVVGGVPTALDDHLERMADLSLELAAQVATMQAGMAQPISVRIGIHAGPVVAGVIGVKKFIYDVWGDTVNLASRMEMLGKPGRVHVTQAVYQRLRDSYDFEPRGVIEVKGKGPLPTYFLVGRQAAAPAIGLEAAQQGGTE
jgi:class 3 adenylate cyclase